MPAKRTILMRINNLTDCINMNGISKEDLYSREGTLLISKHKPVPRKVFTMPIYVFRDIAYDTINVPDTGIRNNQCDERDLWIAKVRDRIGGNTVDSIDSATNDIIAIHANEHLNAAKIKHTHEIITEFYQKDRYKVYSAIQLMRTANSYLYHHSFACYLLFAQALHDFRKYIDKDTFWNAFKNSYDSVSFNPISIKKYAIGVVLHDFGKTMVDQKTLNKRGPLTMNEYAEIMRHPALGVKALRHININNYEILEIVGNHHAHHKVYSNQFQSPLAVICNIVDIYDACRSPCCYHKALSIEKTKEILEQEFRQNKWNPFIYTTLMKETFPAFEKSLALYATSLN